MLAANIESEIRTIIEKHGKAGWMRTEECAKKYAKGNASKETKFYRWRKKVEEGKVQGFQVVKLPGNISFIGLASANPKQLQLESEVENREIELTIELPALDEDEREEEARLYMLARALNTLYHEPGTAREVEAYLKKRKELRTVKVKGRNIDAIKEDLPKIIMQALEKYDKTKPFWKRKVKLPEIG